MEGELLMLGDLLRKTREEKNLSLSDIEKGTNIRKLYIKAIEEGDYGKLPGEVFCKGFIKTYAKFLGLDGQALIEQYKAEKNQTNIQPSDVQVELKNSDSAKNSSEVKSSANEASTAKEAVKQVETAKVDKEVEQKVEKDSKKTAKPANKAKSDTKVSSINSFATDEQYLKARSSGNKKNIVLLIIIIVVIIGGAIGYLSLSKDSSDTKVPTPTTQEQTSSQAEQQASTPPPAPVTGSEVVAVFNQDCWTEVKVDGNIVLSETVKAGTNLNWKANQQIDITVGNAGAVDITFNGQPAGKLGDVGAVVTKSFPAPNAQPAQAQVQQQQVSNAPQN